MRNERLTYARQCGESIENLIIKRAEYLDALANYATTPEVLDGFSPYPAKWLKQERWLDETQIYNGERNGSIYGNARTIKSKSGSSATRTGSPTTAEVLEDFFRYVDETSPE